MEFIGSFGRTAGTVLGLYAGVKVVIEIESCLSRKRKEKVRSRKHEQPMAQQQSEQAQRKAA